MSDPDSSEDDPAPTDEAPAALPSVGDLTSDTIEMSTDEINAAIEERERSDKALADQRAALVDPDQD